MTAPKVDQRYEELQQDYQQLLTTNDELHKFIASTQVLAILLDRNLRVKRFTPSITSLFALTLSAIGRSFANVSHKLLYNQLSEDAHRVLTARASIEQEVRTVDGGWFRMRLAPYYTNTDQIGGVIITFVDITTLKEIEETLAARVRQQATVASLGQFALEKTDLALLFTEAAHRIVETLNVEMCKILELSPDGENLLLKAGVGWREGLVGVAKIGTEKGSQAGYALLVGQPVLVEDLRTENRFSGPTLLVEHNVVSGISVVIQGIKGAYGVLGVHTTQPRRFSNDDVHFVQSVANVLAQAIERHNAQEALAEANEILEERVIERTAQVRALASALTLAEQHERQRIAGILHDHLQQLLYALLFRSKLIQEGEAEQQAALLPQFRELIEEAINSTRTLTIDLSPPILAGEGVVETLDWLAQQMQEVHNLTVSLIVVDEPVIYEKEMRVLLFQFVRELLFNVVKHAGVAKARLVIRCQDEYAVIEVTDYGRGFDVEQVTATDDPKTGFGLFSIRERLGLFGGRLEIQSSPDAGTIVTVFFPLNSSWIMPDRGGASRP
jgi:two-component system CheB/CheR fusion protein